VLCTNGDAGTAERSLHARPPWRPGAPRSSAPPPTSCASSTSSCSATPTDSWTTRASSSATGRARHPPVPPRTPCSSTIRTASATSSTATTRKAGLTTTGRRLPLRTRPPCIFPEHITQEGLAPHKVRELWYWGADEPDLIVDVTDSIDRQIAALVRHESQMPGFNVATGETIGRAAQAGAAAAAGRGLRPFSTAPVLPAPDRAAVDWRRPLRHAWPSSSSSPPPRRRWRRRRASSHGRCTSRSPPTCFRSGGNAVRHHAVHDAVRDARRAW